MGLNLVKIILVYNQYLFMGVAINLFLWNQLILFFFALLHSFTLLETRGCGFAAWSF